MKSTVDFRAFCDSFSETYKDNFSYDGKRALFDYLTEYEKSTGEELELDPVAYCCEYTEYDDLAEINAHYSREYTLEELRDVTQVIECENGHIIIADF